MIENMGWLSLLPPILAIVLVLITKESVISLIIGAFAGCFIAAHFNPVKSLEVMFDVISTQMKNNIYIILFLTLLGALIAVMTDSGGATAYGDLINRKIKSKTGAQLMSVLLGTVFFIDDYFNCLTNGVVMSPIFEKQKISREKFSYILHSIGVPICMLIPMSSWVAVFLSTLDSCGVEDSFELFIRTIPYNFYSILTVLMILAVVLLKLDFGPMLKFERKADVNEAGQVLTSAEKEQSDMFESKNINTNINKKARDLVVPIIFLIVFSMVSLLYKGGYFSGEVTILQVLKKADSAQALTYGAAISLLVSFCMSVFSKRMKLKSYVESATEGIKSMIPAFLILILAWTVGGICREIGTGEYVRYLVQSLHVPVAVFPLIIFAFSGLLAFATGTAWGVYGILVPVVLGLAQGLSQNEFIILISATVAGSTMGNHASPISDSCILSSAGAKCEYINHVVTQSPYIILILIISCLNYILINFVSSLFIIYLLSVSEIILMLYYLNKKSCKSFESENM